LPDVLKFPGFSLEKSLEFFIEEYGTIDTTSQVVYVEVHRRGTPWLFQLEEEMSQFDRGSYDFSNHRRVFNDCENAYALWFKYVNCTASEYY